MTPAQDFSGLTAQYLQAQLASDRREAVRLMVEDGFNRGATVRDLLQLGAPAEGMPARGG